MLRVVVALLLAAAALAAVDLSGLVDVVYNTTSPLERFAPTYVFEVDGCRVLVYVVNSTLEKMPETVQMRDIVYYSRNTTLRLLTSAEVEKLLDTLFQALGPSAKVEVVVRTNFAWWYRDLRVEVIDVAQLAEKAGKAVETDFYLGAADAQKALERGAEQVAYLYRVKWRRGDIAVVFTQFYSLARLEVWTANLSVAVETLEKAREVAGGAWNSVEVKLWHGPYLIPDDVAFRLALENAARNLEFEHGNVWEFRDEEGRVKRVFGYIRIFVDEVGPLYVVFPYPNGAAPDRATAERLVRRFVELSGFCKSPLVVEFWPWPEYNPVLMVGMPPLWPYIAEVGAALAVAVGLLVLTRRRK